MKTGLAPEGTAWPAVRERMQAMKAHDWDVHAGRLPLDAYYAGSEAMRVVEEAFMMFVHQN